MRWLFLKDLQILRRSPLLVALLVIYPIVIAVLFGLALSGGPDKPKVAFANLVPSGDSQFEVGGRTLDALLDTLETIKADLLLGQVSEGRLNQLMVLVTQARERNLPELDDVLDDIELRARVELAKFGRYPAG